MRTQVSILHNDYPAGVREIVDSKLQNLFRFASEKVSVRAMLERQRGQHRVEIVASVPHGRVLVADARAGGFAGALDEAIERMARRLKQSRERRTSRTRRRREGPREVEPEELGELPFRLQEDF